MARITVITSDSAEEAQDGIIVFPQNSTLYIDQFTDKAPADDEEREVFKPRNMEEVFEYYRPSKYGIALKTEEGKVVYEDFCFRSIADFDDNQLLNQSELLSVQDLNSQAKDCLRNNLFYIHEQAKDLEIAYRTLNAFFDNAGKDKVDCLTLMNVNKSKLGSYDSEDSKAIREELQKNYQRLNPKQCYSLLVLPGYLGDAETVRMWARTAYENKVIIVTDFKDCTDFEALHKDLDGANLQGQDGVLSHVVMTCNYLLGRERSEHAQEEDDLFIPGSGALAGRMTDTESIPISRGVAGMKYGILSNVKDTRFDLSKMQIATLMDQGVVPMVKTDGHVMPFSNRSLYDGAILGLQEYPIVRVIDWIEKVIQNYFNTRALLNWNSKVQKECYDAIISFLSDCKSPQKQLIENYELKKLELDSINKEIHLEIVIPLFGARRLLMEMVGHIDGRREINWQ